MSQIHIYDSITAYTARAHCLSLVSGLFWVKNLIFWKLVWLIGITIVKGLRTLDLVEALGIIIHSRTRPELYELDLSFIQSRPKYYPTSLIFGKLNNIIKLCTRTSHIVQLNTEYTCYLEYQPVGIWIPIKVSLTFDQTFFNSTIPVLQSDSSSSSASKSYKKSCNYLLKNVSTARVNFRRKN